MSPPSPPWRALFDEGDIHQSLLELVAVGDVSAEDAMEAASEPHDLLLKLQEARLVQVGAAVGS